MFKTFKACKDDNRGTKDKYTALSVLTVACERRELNDFAVSNDLEIEITRWEWRYARMHVTLFGAGGINHFKPAVRNNFYSEQQLVSMVGFHYSDKCMQAVTYRYHNIRLSNGSDAKLPKCIRLHPHNELYDMYCETCKLDDTVPVKKGIFYSAVNVASKDSEILPAVPGTILPARSSPTSMQATEPIR